MIPIIRTYLFAGLLVCMGTGVWAQLPQFRSVPIGSTLNKTLVGAGIEDSNGLLWLFAQDGIWQFDGSTCVPYKGARDESGKPISMVSNRSAILSAYRPNWIWMGNYYNGLWGMDLLTGKTVHYRYDPTVEDSPGGNSITSLLETEGGMLWFTSDNFTLTCYNGKKFRRFSPRYFEGGPHTPAEGGVLGELIRDTRNPDWLWAGSRFGVYRFNIKTETFDFFRLPQPPPAVYEGYLLALHSAQDGRLWAGGMLTNLLWLNPSDPQGIQLREIKPDPKATAAYTIYDIESVNDSLIMFFSSGRFLWTYHTRTGKTVNFKTLIYDGPNYILTRHKESDPQIQSWFIVANSLIYRFTNAPSFYQYRSFTEQNPELDKNNWQRSWCLSPDNRYVFLGTLLGNGLLRRDWKKDTIDLIVPVPTHPDFPDESPMLDDLFFDPDGQTLWIGSTQGLMYWRDGEASANWWFPPGKNIQNGAPAIKSHISAIYTDDQKLWLGTQGSGVIVVDKKTGVQHPLFRPDSDLAKKTLQIRRMLYDGRHRLWIGCDEGLISVSPDNESILEKFMPANEKGESLLNEHVNDLELDAGGKLWIGTSGGLHCYNPAAQPGQRMTMFRNQDIDLANSINDMVIASDGRIWMATEYALTIFEPERANFVNYSTHDNLFPRHRLIYQIPEGGPVIGGANHGFLQFDVQIMKPGPAPRVYWRDFRIFDQPTSQSANLNSLHQIVLESGQNHFSFEFGAINFEEGALNKFAYQLEGYDGDWVYSGDRTFVSYTNLSPGKYRFFVKAANRYGIWSEPKAIDLEILPPFYLTWWFALFLAVCIGIFAWQASRAWEERRRAMEAQKIIDYFANSNYSGSSVDEILWDVARNCISRLNFEEAVIYLVDPVKQVLVQKAATGLSKAKGHEIIDRLEIPVGQGIVGAVARSGKAEIIGDTTRDPRYIIDQASRMSEIAVPINHNGRIIGVIDSEHSKRNFFKPQDLDILHSIANLIAAKIVKAEAEEAVRKQEAQLLELDKRLAQSELTALKAQMNPHFLFNSLNSINWYIVKNKTFEASKYLTKFSRLIRLILQNSKYYKVTLASELETLRLYIEMESIRFEQKFEYVIRVDDDLEEEEVKIPPMILQPYVENAIWHGLMPLDGQRSGLLSIDIHALDKHLLCVIEDNGIGRQAAQQLQSGAVGSRESQGMRITAERIAILNQKEGEAGNWVKVEDVLDTGGSVIGTRVSLTLPIDL